MLGKFLFHDAMFVVGGGSRLFKNETTVLIRVLDKRALSRCRYCACIFYIARE
jgi:hypothetical protein